MSLISNTNQSVQLIPTPPLDLAPSNTPKKRSSETTKDLAALKSRKIAVHTDAASAARVDLVVHAAAASSSNDRLAVAQSSPPQTLLNVEKLFETLPEKGVNKNLIAKIIHVASEVFKKHNENSSSSSEDKKSIFYDIDQSEHPDLPKMHIFYKPTKKNLDLYVEVVSQPSDENDRISGIAKTFNKALHILLTPSTPPKIKWVAKLILNFKDDVEKNEKLKNQLEDEVSMLKELIGCKYIAQIQNWDINAGVIYQKLANEGSLEKFLSDNPDFTYEKQPKAFLSLCLDMLKGLDEMYENSVVHRDLLEVNVLVTTVAESKLRALITDFGTACDAGDIAEDYEEDYQGFYGLFSPERMKNCLNPSEEFKISSKSDVWAMGALFYWMLCRTRPRWCEIVNLLVDLNAIIEQVIDRQDEVDEEGRDEIDQKKDLKSDEEKGMQLFESNVSSVANLIEAIPLARLIHWGPEDTDKDKDLEAFINGMHRLISGVLARKRELLTCQDEELIVEKLLETCTLIENKLDQVWSAMKGQAFSNPLHEIIVKHMFDPVAKTRSSAKKLIKVFKKVIKDTPAL